MSVFDDMHIITPDGKAIKIPSNSSHIDWLLKNVYTDATLPNTDSNSELNDFEDSIRYKAYDDGYTRVKHVADNDILFDTTDAAYITPEIIEQLMNDYNIPLKQGIIHLERNDIPYTKESLADYMLRYDNIIKQRGLVKRLQEMTI